MTHTKPSTTPHELAPDLDPPPAPHPIGPVGDRTETLNPKESEEEEDASDDDDPRHDRDLVLSLDWRTTSPSWRAALNLPPLAARKGYARDAILLQAIMADHLGYPGVSYSRRNSSYGGKQRYYGPAWTYAVIVSVIDHLGEFGLLEQWTPQPGLTGLQSTFCATPLLLAAVPPALFGQIVQRPHELVRLRDANRHWLDYTDNARTNRMRRNLIKINEALAATSIGYAGLDSGHPGQAFRVGKATVYPMKVQYRVFNRDFRRGGRFYGGGWQCAPKTTRPRITIDGEPIVELDYARCIPDFFTTKPKRGWTETPTPYPAGTGMSRSGDLIPS